jgi:CRP-like cAMP-binding protein
VTNWFKRSPLVPIGCRQCPIKELTVCRPLVGERISVVQRFKSGDRILPAGSDIFRFGEGCSELFNVLDGWVATYQVLASGRRQILDIALPGAFLGYQPDLHAPMSYGAECITDVAICVFPRHAFPDLAEMHPEIAMQLAWLNSRDYVRAQEHLTNVGSRGALSRVAHFLVELCRRVGGPDCFGARPTIELPLTQQHIADALGLTNVYVNRLLRQLREEEVLSFKDRTLHIFDPAKLLEIADYETYETRDGP